MKKTLILCIIASLLCFASCGKKDNAQNNASETPNAAEQSAETPEVSAEPQEENSSAETTEGEPENGNEEETENSNDAEAEAPASNSEKESSPNKLEPATYYGGPVKSIEGDKLVIVSDVTDEEIEFTLTEKAKNDIAHFSVAEGTVVVVDYELSEDGNTKTATNVNLVLNTGKRE